MEGFGRRSRSWGIVLIASTALSVLVGVSRASADHCGSDRLAALLIEDDHLGPDFEPVPEVSGELNQRRLQDFASGQDVSAFSQFCGYVRVWLGGADEAVQATVLDMGSPEAANALLSTLKAGFAGQGRPFAVPGVTDSGGLAIVVNQGPDPFADNETAITSFRSGDYVFMLSILAPVVEVDLALLLTVRQAALSPGGVDRTEERAWSEITSQMTGGFLFLVLVYLLGVTGVAWARDPLRRGRGRPASPTPPIGARVVDVSRRARRRLHIRRVGLAAQVLGLSLALPGLLPAFWPDSLILVAVGAALLSLPAWLQRRAEALGEGRGRRLFTGRRRLPVTLLSGAALVLFAAAAMLATTTMLVGLDDSPLVVAQPSGEHISVDRGIIQFLPWVLAVFAVAAAVALSRRARRLAAFDARAIIERDTRPIVLYLRSFADDDLRVRSGVTGRRSLVEQLGPRRFDGFEQVIAWRLNELGPVVALNPPGTTLSPLGAARTTLGSEEWQDTIDGWMRQAAAIVVGAPPSEPTAGLQWELERIDRDNLWWKTVLVVPAAQDDDVRARWDRFGPLLARVTASAGPLPSDPAAVLVAKVVPGIGWDVVTADERTEWSYAEALREILGQRTGGPVPAQTPAAAD